MRRSPNKGPSCNRVRKSRGNIKSSAHTRRRRLGSPLLGWHQETKALIDLSASIALTGWAGSLEMPALFALGQSPPLIGQKRA